MGAKRVFSVITSLVVFGVAWTLAEFFVKLINEFTAMPTFIFNFSVWIVAPLVGAYAGIAQTHKWFKVVRVETIYVGFRRVFLTLMTIAFGFSAWSALNRHADFSEWLNIFFVLGQVVAAVFGAAVAKNAIAKDSPLSSAV